MRFAREKILPKAKALERAADNTSRVGSSAVVPDHALIKLISYLPESLLWPALLDMCCYGLTGTESEFKAVLSARLADLGYTANALAIIKSIESSDWQSRALVDLGRKVTSAIDFQVVLGFRPSHLSPPIAC